MFGLKNMNGNGGGVRPASLTIALQSVSNWIFAYEFKFEKNRQMKIKAVV